MNKNLLRTTLLSLALGSQMLPALADNYVIYPIPQSVTMENGMLTLSSVNVVYETGIDQITRDRLESLLKKHGITIEPNAKNATTTIRLGIAKSGEAVDKHATDVLHLQANQVVVPGKYDCHAIHVGQDGITVIGEHTNAVFFGLASIEQMLEQMHDGAMEFATIYDHADQESRGLVEGYYGYPYSVEVKKDLMHYMMRYKMNTYMYGAKSDPYHSQMWKDAYPTTISAEQEKNGWLTQDMIKDISQVSAQTKVNFIWAIHPGNDFLGSNTVIEDIMSKFQKMHSLGIRQFGVFVDDVSIPSSDADMKKNADRLSQLQTEMENKWNKDATVAADTVRPLHFVPQIYCNSFASSVDQRKRFMAALNKVQPYITVYSTGQGVWSVPNNNHTATIIQEFGRPMGWWWNYPCNDNADGQIYPMDMYSNFVDMPAIGNNERLPSSLDQCQGIVANPMQQGQVAKTSLFSIADYAWNNTAFRNEESWEASFESIIQDQDMRQAYHDITYYLRWNDPQSLQNQINEYKASLEAGKPNSAPIMATVQKVKADCETVMGLSTSQVKSDQLLYSDIAPWLHTLHTYAIVTEKMLNILDAPADEKKAQWLNVKEVCDSLNSLEHSTLYTAYALEGMGNSISVSSRQAQLSRNHWFPFISYLRSHAIDNYFHDPTALTQPTAISNSPLLKASVLQKVNVVKLTMKASDFDVQKYVGFAMPAPTLVENAVVAEQLLPYVRYSTDGKVWNTVDSLADLKQKHISHLILLNDSDKGIKNFTISDGDVEFTFPTKAQPTDVTLPNGSIYQNHTGNLMIDGKYDTYTCLNRNQQKDDAYTIDLGASMEVHDVRLCLGLTNGDHPNGCVVQVSNSGKTWTNIKVKGTNTKSWNIDLEQNVHYSDEMVYCDFDAEGRKAKYVRVNITNPNTSKWLRFYELEVNRQYAESSTLAECTAGNGEQIKVLTDRSAITGIAANAISPITYSFNRINNVRGITCYGMPNGVGANISVTTDGTEWTNLGQLTEACQTVDLQSHPAARAMRIEWTGEEAPLLFELMPDYDMSTSSLPSGESQLAKDFALLKSLSVQALDSCGQGDKLITDNNQFSSPYTETQEGSLNNLLDGNKATFWHSTWSGGAVADGLHYLEIALPQDTQGDVILHFGRRSNAENHNLIKARIQGVVSGNGTSAKVEDVVDLDLPFGSQTETVVRQFHLPKAYSSIRLLELQTTGANGTSSGGFFHVGELQIYDMKQYYILKNAKAEADALIAAMDVMPSEATETDLQKLQAAYDAFMHKVFDKPVGIESVNGNLSPSSAPVIYDISGRRVSASSMERGQVYIINGKKYICK